MARLIAAVALAGIAIAASPPLILGARPPFPAISPSLAEIQASAATALSLSPTSDVKGKAFDRIMQIWLENTNFNSAAGNPDMQWLASKGILLTNYWAVTHPSEPNYAAAVAGDYLGMDNGDFNRFPENVSTVVDLLDTKGISWGEYQENLPYAGFQGFNFSDQRTFRNNYMRKHNPLILFDSVVNNATRLALIKNETAFEEDLRRERLPQWSFYTPNMLNDGHDTNITFASTWTRNFLEPLLENEYFMNRTLVIVSFDENEVYSTPNKVYTVLLGGAVNSSLQGTTDDTFYNHYSTISSVSQNWDLPSLGRWDCGANVFALLANKTGYRNAAVDAAKFWFNFSYPGPFNNRQWTPWWWPAPNTVAKCTSGKGVLEAVKKTWGVGEGTYDYVNAFPYEDTWSGVTAGMPRVVGANDVGTTWSGGSSGSPGNTGDAAGARAPSAGTILGFTGLVAAIASGMK